MRMPSWKISVESAALDPGTRPPTSVWCAMVQAKASRLPSTKIGWNTKMSGRCMPPSNGSFIANTSPGWMSPSKHFITDCSATGIAPRCPDSVSPCATITPSPSANAVEKSMLFFTTEV